MTRPPAGPPAPPPSCGGQSAAPSRPILRRPGDGPHAPRAAAPKTVTPSLVRQPGGALSGGLAGLMTSTRYPLTASVTVLVVGTILIPVVSRSSSRRGSTSANTAG